MSKLCSKVPKKLCRFFSKKQDSNNSKLIQGSSQGNFKACDWFNMTSSSNQRDFLQRIQEQAFCDLDSSSTKESIKRFNFYTC